MAVPYTFGSATSAIPLSQLDSNFATAITLGNTAIQLGNTVTTLNNMTLANVTVSSGNVTITTTTVANANVTSTLTLSGLTASTALALDASKNVVSVTNTGSGNNVLATSPTLTTPNLGTPSAATLTNATGLPLSTGVTGTLATTNGGTGLTSFTANGVVYASSTSALTTGSALTYTGSAMSVNSGGVGGGASMALTVNGTFGGGIQQSYNNSGGSALVPVSGGGLIFYTYTGANASESYSEQMRLTSTGLGIGTSSPGAKLHSEVSGSTAQLRLTQTSYASYNFKVTTASALTIDKDGTLFATLDSSGNLGLGVTPSAWNLAGQKVLQVANASLTSYTSDEATISGNAYYSSGWKYIATNYAEQYTQQSGKHIWYTAPSGTAGSAITFTQAMTLDASGNLLINSTSALRARSGQVQIIATSAQEALTTSSNDLTYSQWVARSADSGAGTHYLAYFEKSTGTAVGSITHDNTNTAYNTSSDYRLKDKQQPLTGSGSFIDALQPKTWIWKESGDTGVGFIAHEVQEVSPSSVVGEKDAVDADGKPVFQAMEYGSAEFIANIIAELQSLRARLAAAGI